MHGAAGALLVETISIGTMLAIAKPGFFAIPSNVMENRSHLTCVTRNLSLTWLRSAMLGMTLQCKSSVINASRTQILMRVELFDKATGKQMLHGLHEMQSAVATAEKMRDFESKL